MVIKTVNDQSLIDIANAIREKTGKSNSIEFPNGFVNEIGEIKVASEEIVITDFSYFHYTNSRLELLGKIDTS